MKPKRTFELVLIAIGFGFLISGFGLGLLFGSLDVSAKGPAGIAVAILFGCGICLLLFAALQPITSVSGFLKPNNAELSESERPRSLAELSVSRAKLAICFSAAATVMAFALFYGGIKVAFIGFNFASGTNDVGLITLLTGIVVGIIAIVSSLVAILLGWSAGNASGKFYWFFAALAVPLFQAVTYLVGTYLTK